MNIILLSGGSGKRLWPLSNEIRSKQFIRLFKDEQGEYESMVQRVYRQIRTADPEANVTIATSKTQVSAIRNQLGNAVSVCVEPMRRDTFPAIALAAAYLRYEEGVGEEETAVVCPVDPYVENSYFENLKKLDELAKNGEARLVLMGIEPDSPSEKYGYIIPEDMEFVSSVKAFKEKPDTATAEGYLAQGALWNAGVFAFKLSYVLDIARRAVDFEDYRDLYLKYEKLPKISFDYAVVEKEPSIRVMRYFGEWKDVGTWNTMAEAMADKTKGNVMLDETAENVHVVNELDIPILVMGGKDMIIAASGDGILVADKERSGSMKPYVEKIVTDVRFAEKSWGSITVVDAEPGSVTMKVVMKPGTRMSYHSHDLRNEIWTVLSGRGMTVVDDMEQQIGPGDVVSVAAGCRHTVIADTDLTLLEIQIGSEISAADKKKYELNGAPFIDDAPDRWNE